MNSTILGNYFELPFLLSLPFLALPNNAIISNPAMIQAITIYAGRLNGNAGTGYTVLRIANAMNLVELNSSVYFYHSTPHSIHILE